MSSLLGSKVSIAGCREDVCVNAKTSGAVFGGQRGIMGSSVQGGWNLSGRTERLTPTPRLAQRSEVLVPGIQQAQLCRVLLLLLLFVGSN